MWDKNPKLDAQLSKVSKKKYSLAFQDMGHLKDCTDKRDDIILKRTWETSVASLKLVLATSVARNLEFWLSQLQDHIKTGTPREEILKTLAILSKAVGYIADVSTESVKLAARSGGLAWQPHALFG